MFYCLECQSEEVSCDFWINDIPVTKRGLDDGGRFDGPVNPYLIEGINELSIEISPAKQDEQNKEPRWHDSAPQDASVRATLSQYPFGAIVGGPDAIERASLEWHVSDFGNASMWPLVKTVHFDIGLGLGEMIWQQADILDPQNPANFAGAMDLLNTLHHALDTNDHDTWVELHTPRLADADRGYRGKIEPRATRARQELNYEAAEGRRMDTLQTDTSAWRICAEGRLIECRMADGRSNIREVAQANGNIDHYPVFAGCINGTWLPLR